MFNFLKLILEQKEKKLEINRSNSKVNIISVNLVKSTTIQIHFVWYVWFFSLRITLSFPLGHKELQRKLKRFHLIKIPSALIFLIWWSRYNILAKIVNKHLNSSTLPFCQFTFNKALCNQLLIKHFNKKLHSYSLEVKVILFYSHGRQ